MRLLIAAALLPAVLLPSFASAAGHYYDYDRKRDVRREIREGRQGG